MPRPRLALAIAFISGLTSLGYQVTWTRLLASGTGNTTYVFTVILATFLIGIAIGALLFAVAPARGSATRSGCSPPARSWPPRWRSLGLVFVLGRAARPDPRQADRDAPGAARVGRARRPAGDDRARHRLPGVVRAPPRRRAHAGGGSGRLLAVNTVGAIIGSLVVPFVLIPLLGSPVLVAVLAGVNAVLGIVLGWRLRRPTGRHAGIAAARGRRRASVDRRHVVRPGVLVQPNEAYIASVGRTALRLDRGRDRVGPGRPDQTFTPELWVAGHLDDAADRRRQADADPAAHRPPESTRALVVAFGMGSAFRGALIAGLKTDAVELVPTVPKMFGYYYPDAAAGPRRTRTAGSSSPTAGTTSS